MAVACFDPLRDHFSRHGGRDDSRGKCRKQTWDQLTAKRASHSQGEKTAEVAWETARVMSARAAPRLWEGTKSIMCLSWAAAARQRTTRPSAEKKGATSSAQSFWRRIAAPMAGTDIVATVTALGDEWGKTWPRSSWESFGRGIEEHKRDWGTERVGQSW